MSYILELSFSLSKSKNITSSINNIETIAFDHMCDKFNINYEFMGKNRKVYRHHFILTFIFEENDIEESLEQHKKEAVSVIVGMFVLQFLGYRKRERVLKLLSHYVNQGTKVLLSEKVYLSDPQLQTLLHCLHIQEKRKGFTDTEILDKDSQLSVSMYCKNQFELDQELQKIGCPIKVWQSYNFMGYVVGKDKG